MWCRWKDPQAAPCCSESAHRLSHARSRAPMLTRIAPAAATKKDRAAIRGSRGSSVVLSQGSEKRNALFRARWVPILHTKVAAAPGCLFVALSVWDATVAASTGWIDSLAKPEYAR